jgi:hypothetical protein
VPVKVAPTVVDRGYGEGGQIARDDRSHNHTSPANDGSKGSDFPVSHEHRRGSYKESLLHEETPVKRSRWQNPQGFWDRQAHRAIR